MLIDQNIDEIKLKRLVIACEDELKWQKSKAWVKENLLEMKISEKTGDLAQKVKHLSETETAMLNILEDSNFLQKVLKEERDQATAILSSMGEGLMVVDVDYKIIVANNAAENILGVALNDLLDNNIRNLIKLLKGNEIIPEGDHPALKMFKTGEIVKIGMEDNIYYQVSLSGKKIPISSVIAPLKKDSGVVGAVIVFEDVSEEKALEEARSNFVSTASHQLRTPLTAIRWYTEMLNTGDAGPLSDEQKKFLSEIYGGVLRLGDTLNILLILARVEGGRMKMKAEKINIFQFTDNLIKELEPSIKKKNLSVEIKSNCKEIPDINLDPALLSQVIANLLSNAVRYTDENGRIESGINCNKKEIVYYVKDNGIGIPEDQKKSIFEKFFRAENAMIKAPDGNGLGLALVKNIVGLWKGKVWFESELGKGTTFYFTIPIL